MVTALEIPDDPAQIARWIETVLVGPDVGRLVREIEITQEVTGRSPKPTPAIDKVLAEFRTPVLERGLGELPYERVRLLLRYPRTLLELQELVFVEGREYWSGLPRPAELVEATTSQLKKINQAIADKDLIGDQPVRPIASERAVALPENAGKARELSSTKRHWMFSPAGTLALATAASVAFFFVGNWYAEQGFDGGIGAGLVVQVDQSWGWDRPGILAAKLDRSAYLNHLANLAAEWSSERPASASDLKTRIEQFRHSCDTLIAAQHSQLTQSDKDWVVERCKVWAGKLDEQLAALNQTSNLQAVLDATDAIANSLVTALRERAQG